MRRGILSLFVSCCAFLSCAPAVQGQESSIPVGSLLQGKVTLQAEPGCRGCGTTPNSWVPRQTFAAGAKVWVRAVLSNHTHHDVVMTDFRPIFTFKAIDGQGKELRFTNRRCLASCGCYLDKDGAVHRYGESPADSQAPTCVLMETAVPAPEIETVMPGKSVVLFLEITQDYLLSAPGDDRIDVSCPDLWIARARDVPADRLFIRASSIKGAKHLGGLRAKQIAIHVAP